MSDHDILKIFGVFNLIRREKRNSSEVDIIYHFHLIITNTSKTHCSFNILTHSENAIQ